MNYLQAKVNALSKLQSRSGEELRRRRTLTSSLSAANGMPSVLDRVFKGEL